MTRTNFSRFVAAALALVFCIALLSVDSQGYGGDKGKSEDKGKGKDKGNDNGKKTGQTQVVHGCIVKVTLASGMTLGTVEFTHPKFGGTVKVIETGTPKTDIQVCGETKTLAQLKVLVEAVKSGQPKYCGIARIDDRTSLKASKIIVCNDGDD